MLSRFETFKLWPHIYWPRKFIEPDRKNNDKIICFNAGRTQKIIHITGGITRNIESTYTRVQNGDAINFII